MSVSLDLHLEDRQADRVWVSVRVAPDGEPRRVDGVALQLCARDGEALGPRLLLPICGCLESPIVTRVELKAAAIPRDGQVVAIAWWGQEQIEARCPADVGTGLEGHMRGHRQLPLATRIDVAPLAPDERAVFVRRMPWVAAPMIPFDPRGIEPLESEPTSDQICEELGLDGEDAEWLKDLLDEDETSL